MKEDSISTTERGFMLLELLMVAAIIGLLSAIVVASISTARVKAQNQSANETIRSYINALELYKSESPGLEYPSGGTDYVCLGCPGFECSGDVANDATAFNAILASYIPTPTDKCRYSGPIGSGIRYTVCVAGTACGYSIEWELGGEGERCLGGGGSSSLGLTSCIYTAY
jgi:type II secretory pathway pseudopilin PulG